MRQVWAWGVADDMCHKRRRKVVEDEEVNWHEERFSGFPPKRLKAIVVSSRNCFGVESSSGIGRNSSHSTTDEEEADWTRLPDDTLLKVFTLLNHRDRASLASVCRGWRTLAASASLWTSLDIRAHVLDSDMTAALSSRCAKLQRLRFRGGAAATAIVGLQARGLRDLSGDSCGDLSDASLCMMVARHEALESLQLQLGVDCERITNDAIKVVATCCPKLKRLRISGIRDVDAPTIGALAKHCPDLMDLAFFDCTNVDEVALAAATSLRFLSVAGSRVISWSLAAEMWPKLPQLTGLDVSRTDITAVTAAELMAAPKLKVFCAVNCSHLEHGRDAVESFLNPSVLVTQCTDFKKELASLSSIYAGRSPKCKKLTDSLVCKDCHLELTDWTECVLSHALLKTAESNSGLDVFWLNRGTALMLNLLQSQQEEVQERAATALATFVVIDDETESVDPARAEAVLHAGGITHLLRLAKSCREAVQSEAAKAIANLSVNADVAKTVAMEGGISILASLARSPNRRVAEEAAGGLWNLSVGEDHKGAIAGAGAIEALVDLAFKWPSGNEGVLERAAGALANLAADDKCSMEVASAGGVHALVNLARFCHHEGVQEQAARALANLAAHGDSNGNNAAVGKEPGALEALVHLTSSNHEGVRQEAAGALWNLSFDDRNREAIAAVGGVEALVTLAQSCSTGSQGLQERAAGALWGLSVSEVNSIAIGRGGGVAPLIALARSEFEDVHETAAGALWNLAFNPSNALLIVEEEGVPALVHLCSSSQSKMARFMAALALAYMFDGRTDEVAFGPMFSESPGLGVDGLEAARHLAIRNIDGCVLSFSNHQALLVPTTSLPPAALTEVAESAHIQEAGHLRCSGAEVGRFVAMLRNKAAVLRSCAAFALLQFTMPGGRHAMHHISLLQKAGAGRVLRTIAASATAPLQAKVFARVVLRNVELHPAGEHTTSS